MSTSRAAIFLAVTAVSGGCVIGNSTEGDEAVFETGASQPVRFLPGVVEHEVCVATNVEGGYVRAVDFVGIPDVEFIGPAEGAVVQAVPVEGLDCPDASSGFQGWARIRWQTQTGRNFVTFAHERGPFADTGGDESGGGDFKRGVEALASANATSGEIVLAGERFPGYDVFDAFIDDSQPGVVGVSVDLVYRDAGALIGEPASDVPFTVSYTPVELTLFGSSSGTFDLKADRDGHTTLLYNLTSFCAGAFDPNTGEPTNVSVFVTPVAGGTVLAGTLEYDLLCEL